MNPECANCKHLGACKTTDAQKILSHYVCEFFEEVPNQQIAQARYDVIAKFGQAGLKVLTNPNVDTTEET